jgi:GTP pyrophosphokinase
VVQVRQRAPVDFTGELDFDAWYAHLQLPTGPYNPDKIRSAVALSYQTQQEFAGSGANAYEIGLEMAEILVDFKIDENALLAAILYRQVRQGRLELADIRSSFGNEVAQLVDGVLRMALISQFSADPTQLVLGQSEEQAQNIRKMLVSMLDDVRIALIKLAERTVAIRKVKDKPAKRARVAREIFNVYVPLAHRLGLGQLKWELEDLSFRYLHPKTYQQIASLLAEKRVDRERYIKDVVAEREEAVAKTGIEAEVHGRVKHIFSIWRKMRAKGISFSQVYDIRAVRILVDKPHECYAVLGIVHMLWHTVPNEFDDYIGNPKENGYRSLHTAVIGPEGKVLEVQIRTREMHEEAEFGVCAHWVYKGAEQGGKPDTSYEEKIAWLREVLDWHAELQGREQGKDLSAVSQERIYLFTPEGHIVDLPKGATPLDFAYHVHTEIGHRCRGARVDGRVVPLNTELQNGQQVDIIKGSKEAPSRDWLRDELGYARTGRARARVRQWFKRQDHQEMNKAGRALVEREFKRLALTSIDYTHIARKLGLDSVDALYESVGTGTVSMPQLLQVVQQLPGQQLVHNAEPLAQGIQVKGVGTRIAQASACCKPEEGEAIEGYVTRGQKVSVHRTDCSRLLALKESHPANIIEVEWVDGDAQEDSISSKIVLHAYDRKGLLSDITTLLAREQCNLLSVNTDLNGSQNTVGLHIDLEVSDLARLSHVLSQLQQLPNVFSVERQA